MPARLRGLFNSILVQAAFVTCALAILGVMSAPVKANTALYTITDLGSLGCCRDWIWESTALALNNAGDVVGTTTSPTDPSMTLPFILSRRHFRREEIGALLRSTQIALSEEA